LTDSQWKSRVLILLAFTAVSLVALLFLPPIPQDQAYHHYADQRALFGIPNFWNVVSNVPFILIGAAGLRLSGPTSMRIIFLGIFLVGFSSAYYHWAPSDETLIWDRLPMTLGFMAILANIIEERISEKAGVLLLWPLLVAGIATLMVWRFTDDLRLYGWVQFFPIAALLLIFVLFPPKYTGTANWLMAAALYAGAKLPEFYDAHIFSAAGYVVSGHTLKHLLAAAACFVILRNFQTRRPVSAATRN
jgi:hypothetical protein